MASRKNAPIVTAIGLAVLAVVIGYAGVQFLEDYFRYDRYNKQDFIDLSTYQAVFLTNDQIYFGHLKNISSDYLILSDVHYVKIDDNGGQLIKLGTVEPHGPQNRMVINKEQVMFWENLRFDSPVVKAIKN